MFQIHFEGLEFAFKSLKTLSNCSNLHWNDSNPFRMVLICFECFESFLKDSNCHSNVSNPFRVFRICIQILRITFRMVRIYIRMFQIHFEWLEFAFESLKSISNCSNLHSNASNPFRMVLICFEWFKSFSKGSIYIWMFQIHFEWLELAFESF